MGALGLAAIVILAGRLSRLIGLLRIRTIWLMAFGVAGYQVLFFAGTGLTGVAVGTLASLALGPLFTGLLTQLVFRTKQSRAWWLSTALAIFGVGLLSFDALSGNSSLNILGILAAVGAGLCYAIYATFGAQQAGATEHSTDILAAAFLLGAILVAPGLVTADAQLFTMQGWGLVLWLGLGATTIAYVLFGIGLTSLSAGTVATLNLAEPLVAAALGIWLLAEKISTIASIGAVLIATALSLLAYTTLKESTK